MKIIAVSQRTVITEYSTDRECRDCLDQRWTDFLFSAGCLPVLLPNHPGAVEALFRQFNFHGILLTGGNSSIERNAVEFFLIEHALMHAIPLLGVCHGMQSIQQYFGVPIYPVTGHVNVHMPILIDSHLQYVNSYHDVGTHETAEQLSVWARAHDNVVKAVKHVSYALQGIMWHPERFTPFRTEDILYFKNFFKVTA